ncbi:MAG: YqgE/AlgH family protein [Nitrospinaceae bacterium]
MEFIEYGKGSLLIANPVLPDPNFSRTVVLLCNHNEEGSFGLVVNRKAELMAREVFPKSDLLRTYDADVFIGGPVAQSQVFYLIRHAEPLADLEPVCPGIQMGMSWETLEEVFPRLNQPGQDLRFYLGYSGWGSGQLAGEMEQRSWLIRQANDDFVFPPQENQLWHNVVRSLGKDYEYLLHAPVDPRWN